MTNAMRLVPSLPFCFAALVACSGGKPDDAADAAAIAAGQLEPMAFDVRSTDAGDGPRWTLLVRFASSPAAVATQLDAARALVRGDTTALREGLEARAWAEQVALAWDPDSGTGGAVVRCSWLPSRLGEVLAMVMAICREADAREPNPVQFAVARP